MSTRKVKPGDTVKIHPGGLVTTENGEAIGLVFASSSLKPVFEVKNTSTRKEALDQAWKAYQEARAQVEKEYQEATAQARRAYKEARAQAVKTYKEAKAQAEKLPK